MLKEMILTIFFTSLVLGIVYAVLGIGPEGRLIIGGVNGFVWGIYFYNKYYVTKNNEKGDNHD